MPDIKISALPTASIVNDADIVVLNQGGQTKTATKSLVVAGLASTAQLSDLTNTAQVSAIASEQIAAITPASIGAISTDAASGFATTEQLSGCHLICRVLQDLLTAFLYLELLFLVV